MFTRNRWTLAGLICSMLAMSPLAGAAPRMTRYRIVEIGALPKTDVVVGTSLNNRGQAVGYAYKHVPPGHGNAIFARAFLWEKGKLRALATPQGEFAHASEINDAGDIAGDAETPGAWHPVRWNAAKPNPVMPD